MAPKLAEERDSRLTPRDVHVAAPADHRGVEGAESSGNSVGLREHEAEGDALRVREMVCRRHEAIGTVESVDLETLPSQGDGLPPTTRRCDEYRPARGEVAPDDVLLPTLEPREVVLPVVVLRSTFVVEAGRGAKGGRAHDTKPDPLMDGLQGIQNSALTPVRSRVPPGHPD